MNELTIAPTILNHFASLEDPLVERTKEHLLIDIVAIAICAVICGADSWCDIENYGNDKQQWLASFLALPNGIPSHDTFARVFARLNPEQLQACFLSWIETISTLTQGEVVAIDGKTLRQSYDTQQGKGAIHMVRPGQLLTAWCWLNSKLMRSPMKSQQSHNYSMRLS